MKIVKGTKSVDGEVEDTYEAYSGERAASHRELVMRILQLEDAMRSAIKSAEANGMGDWKQFAILRKLLKI